MSYLIVFLEEQVSIMVLHPAMPCCSLIILPCGFCHSKMLFFLPGTASTPEQTKGTCVRFKDIAAICIFLDINLLLALLPKILWKL